METIKYICVNCNNITTINTDISIVCNKCHKRMFRKESVKIPVNIKAV